MAGLALLFFGCLLPHLTAKLLLRRSPWPRFFLRTAARIVGARVTVTGDPIGPHTLLISNHVSWIDILVLGGGTGCAFVSKDSLGHGFIHWLADQNHTLYVRRSERRDAKNQALTIAKALERDQPVALFPEGTTGPGTELLPFRSTLLEAASFVSTDVEVRPVAIDYGDAAAEVGWFNESGKDNVLRLLGRPRTLQVTVRLLPPLPRADRKAMATAAREAIAAALAASNSQRARL